MSLLIQVSYLQISDVPATFDLKVSDTASIVAANFSDLNALSNVIEIAADATVVLTVADFNANQVAVNRMTTLLVVADSPLLILESLPLLNANASKLSSIIPQSKMSVTYYQYSVYSNACNTCTNIEITEVPCMYVTAIMTSSTNPSIRVSDTDTNINSYASTLSLYSSRITSTTNTSVLYVSEFLTHTFLNGETFKLADFGAEISNNIAFLTTHGSNIISITAKSLLTVNYATWSSNLSLISLVSPANYIHVSGASCANLTTLHGSIDIADTASNIATHLADITTYMANQGNSIASIVVSDNLPVTVNATTYWANTAVMTMLVFADHNVKYIVTGVPVYMLKTAISNIRTGSYNGTLQLLDTYDNMNASADIDTTYVTSATATTPVTIPSSSISNTALLQILTNCTISSSASFFGSNVNYYPRVSFLISDSALNVNPTGSYLNDNISRISSFSISGSIDYSFEVSYIITTCRSVLLKLPDKYVSVVDSGNIIQTNFDALTIMVRSIQSVNWSSGSVTITLAQFLSALGSKLANNFKVTGVDCANLSSVLKNPLVTSVTVSDTVIQIQANFAYLASVSSKITSVVTSGELSVSAAQFLSQKTFILSLTTCTIRIVDTNSAINLNVISNGVLQTTSTFYAIATNYSRISSIFCTDVLNLDYSLQYVPYAATVVPLISGYKIINAPFNQIYQLVTNHVKCVSITTKDTGDISANFLLMNPYANQIDSITCMQPMGISDSTFFTCYSLLAKFTSKQLTVLTIDFSKLSYVLANPAVSSVYIQDTVSNFLNNFSVFSTAANAGIIGMLTLSDLTKTNVNITMDQYMSCKTWFDTQFGVGYFNISPLKSTDTLSLFQSIAALDWSKVNTVTVADTSAQLNDQFSALCGKYYSYHALYPFKIASISCIDGLLLPMSLITAQTGSKDYTGATKNKDMFPGFMALFTNTVTIINAAIASVKNGAPYPNTVVRILDSAANISTNFSSFASYPTAYTAIKLTNTTATSITITAAQATAAPNIVRLLIQSACAVTASGVPCASISYLASVVSSLQIVDTSAAVTTFLSTISSYSSQILSITVTGTTLTNPISLTYAQYTAKPFTATGFALTNVPFGSATTTLLNLSTMASFQLSGSSTDFNTYIALLNQTKVTKVTFSDMGTVSWTASTFTTYVSKITKLPLNSIQIISGTLSSSAILDNASYISSLSSLSAVNVTCDKATAVAAMGASITILDTGANISASIELLEAVLGQVTSITVSSGTISFSSAFLNYAVVALLQSPFTFSDTVSCSQFLSISNPKASSLKIADDPQTIIQNFDALKSSSLISSVASTSDLSLTYTQATTTFAAKITMFSLSDATCAQASTLVNKSNISAIRVTDSASAVLSNLASLSNSKISSVTLVGGQIQLSIALLATYGANTISKMSLNSITIIDTASLFSQNLALLKAYDGQIQTIALA